MPIRLNLLAEAKAIEDMRRRDPVKRAFMVGALLAALILLWAGYIQVQIYLAKKQVGSQADQLAALEKRYADYNQKKNALLNIQERFGKLETLHTNRFLWASALNALQQSMVRDIQVTGLRCEISTRTVELPPKPGAKITKVTKPETECAMRVGIQIDAKDFGPNPGDQVGKFKSSISSNAFFRLHFGKTNDVTLRSLSAPTVDGTSGKGMVLFSLDCKFPDKVMK